MKRFTTSEYFTSIKARIQQERKWQPLECTAFVIRQNMSINWQAMRQHCSIMHFLIPHCGKSDATKITELTVKNAKT
jgi:hypothetical protein